MVLLGSPLEDASGWPHFFRCNLALKFLHSVIDICDVALLCLLLEVRKLRHFLSVFVDWVKLFIQQHEVLNDICMRLDLRLQIIPLLILVNVLLRLTQCSHCSEEDTYRLTKHVLSVHAMPVEDSLTPPGLIDKVLV